MSLDKKTVANRYAKAIFELAEENGQLDQTYQELSALRQVFEENDSLAALLSGVDLSLAEKKSLIDALIGQLRDDMYIRIDSIDSQTVECMSETGFQIRM